MSRIKLKYNVEKKKVKIQFQEKSKKYNVEYKVDLSSEWSQFSAQPLQSPNTDNYSVFVTRYFFVTKAESEVSFHKFI